MVFQVSWAIKELKPHQIMESLKLEKPCKSPTINLALTGAPLTHVPKSHIYTYFEH